MTTQLLKDCPSPKREIICYVCRKPGHITSRCPNVKQNKNNTATGEVSFVSNTVNDQSLWKFVRQIQIGKS